MRKPDYAKWILNDPRANFAISQRAATTGVRHLGIQVEDENVLAGVYARLHRADRPVLDEGATTCPRSFRCLPMLCVNMPTLRIATRSDADAIRTLLELNL